MSLKILPTIQHLLFVVVVFENRNMEKYELMAKENKSAHEKNDIDQQKLLQVRSVLEFYFQRPVWPTFSFHLVSFLFYLSSQLQQKGAWAAEDKQRDLKKLESISQAKTEAAAAAKAGASASKPVRLTFSLYSFVSPLFKHLLQIVSKSRS